MHIMLKNTELLKHSKIMLQRVSIYIETIFRELKSVLGFSLRCMLHEEIILKMYPKGVGLTAWLTIRRRGEMEPWAPYRGEFRRRQTRQLPKAVDLKGRLLSCQSY